MIEAVQTLEGKVIVNNSINGTLNNAVKYIEPSTQVKTITPTKQEQEVKPDEGVFALSKVVVEPIGEEYIIPTGTEEISSNGLYNVKNKEYANVSITPNLQNKSLSITSNTTTTIQADENYDGLNSVDLTINVPNTPNWSSLGFTPYPDTIGEIYNNAVSIQNNWDSSNTTCNFNNNTSIMIFPLIDTSNCTSFNFQSCSSMTEIANLDFSKCTSFYRTFYYCMKLKKLPDSLSNVNFTNIQNLAYSCSVLTYVPELNLTNCTGWRNAFSDCYNLTDESLNNILKSLAKTTYSYGTKTLKEVGFVSSRYPASRFEALPYYETFISKGWSIGY